MNKEETYLNCYLFGGKEKTQGRDGFGYYVAVYPENTSQQSEMLFYESSFMSGTAIACKYGDRNSKNAYEDLGKITFSKAKARIALELYKIGEKYEKNIYNSDEEKKSEKSDNDIQKWILKVLYNIRKKDTIRYKYNGLDVDGFCNILGITIEQYIFNASFLEEENLIQETPIDQLGLKGGNIYINNNGIKYLSLITDEKNETIDNKTQIEEYNKSINGFKYDVAISFAGSERKLAESLASIVSKAGFKVFYDKFYEVELWGKDLAIKFDEVFRIESRFCIVFISDEYSKRMWPRHEIKSALARAIKERGGEYILPIRVDDTDIPGLQPTTGYLSLKDFDVEKIAEILIKKIQGNVFSTNESAVEKQIKNISFKEEIKIVNINYISNIKQDGKLYWSDPEKIEERKLKGYEIYFEIDEEKKTKYLFQNKSDQILLINKH